VSLPALGGADRVGHVESGPAIRSWCTSGQAVLLIGRYRGLAMAGSMPSFAIGAIVAPSALSGVSMDAWARHL